MTPLNRSDDSDPPTSIVSGVVDAAALADALEAVLAPLEAAAARAWWDASVETSAANDERRVAAELAYSEALSDADAFEQVRSSLAAIEADPAADPLTRRRLTLLRDAMIPNQGPSTLRHLLIELGAQVDSEFSSFRGRIGGTAVDDNEINEILRTSDDVDERRAAWEASKQVGAHVADRVLELVRLRNELARELGFRDHVDLALTTSELDEADLVALLDEVDAVTAEPYAAWKAEFDAALAARFGCDPDDLRPWHYDNVFFQDAPSAVDLDRWFADTDVVATAAASYASIGLDVGPVLARSDLLPRDGKNQHAFCASIDRGDDVRMLCNVVPGEEWAGVMLHELGHAVYDLGIDPSLPWGVRTCHPLTTEGIAMMFEKLVREPEWLTAVGGVPASEVADAAAALADGRRAGLLVLARWVLVMVTFERGLYADPDGDHDSRWWDLVERFQRIRRPDGRNEPDWAAKIHLASAPVYYQNYLLGELVALQLRHTIVERFGGLVGGVGEVGRATDTSEVGDFLRDELFAPGASLRWDALIERVTGHPLTARHVVEALGA